MIPLVAGVVLFWIGSMLVREFLSASPAVVARRMRQGGGVVLLVFALLLLMRGQIGLALGFGGLGFWLTTGRRASLWGAARPAGVRRPGGARKGRLSRVRSATIEMELDHATGAMSGVVLAGPFEGASLAQLDRNSLGSLHDFCLSFDGEGARLLEAYFDRRFPGWRGTAQDKAHAGGSGAGPGTRRGVRPGAMSEEEACQLLGLAKGASREEVARAHRSVMKTAHPDHGGSTDLAARVNEAKDVLMRRHQ